MKTLLLAGLLLGASALGDDLRLLHEQCIYTQVRVKTDKTGGSGTIIYSKPNKTGGYSTYVLTCYHVVEDAISIQEAWDPRIGRMRKRELRAEVTVEFFQYGKGDYVDRTYAVRAIIEAYDKLDDMALLRLKSSKRAPYVARLYPRGKENDIGVGARVWIVGCALLHDPIVTEGRITHKGDVIDYKEYWMSNAQIIFGNSGGAVFLQNGYFFIGIPSRVDVVGWGQPVTHLGYFSPIQRVYRFLEQQNFQFIYDPKYTEEQCAAKRAALKRAEEERARILGR